MLEDKSAERATLAGVVQYGSNVWLDVSDLLNDDCFADHINQCVYSCLQHIYHKNGEAVIDLASILSAAADLGLQAELAGETKYIKALFNYHVEEENVLEFSRKLRRLSEVRHLIGSLEQTRQKLGLLTGSESIVDIAALAEKDIFEFTNRLVGGSNSIKPFGDEICEYVEDIIANPKETNGIPIGFNKYSEAIGGISAGIHLISARSGVGKSMHALNIALHAAVKNKIPTCWLDSELFLKGGNYDRALARISGVDFTKINKGQLNEEEQIKVRKAAKFLKKQPLDFLNISCMDFDAVLSLVRKWIHQKTERSFKGNYANALLIYDYIKLTDYSELKNAREYEILGNRMSQLHAFTVEYKLPIIAYVQQNKELQVSQSDRLVWFATSVAALSKKQQEEIASGMLGNRKLIIEKSRWGAGMSDSDFINYNLNGKTAAFTELETAEEFRKKEKERKETTCSDDECV